MSLFGWDLPPGCSVRDIDPGDACCYECKAPLAEDNEDGVCPGACAEKFKERCRRADEAEAAFEEELAAWDGDGK